MFFGGLSPRNLLILQVFPAEVGARLGKVQTFKSPNINYASRDHRSAINDSHAAGFMTVKTFSP